MSFKQSAIYFIMMSCLWIKHTKQISNIILITLSLYIHDIKIKLTKICFLIILIKCFLIALKIIETRTFQWLCQSHKIIHYFCLVS